jgi:uncharacterized protein YgbK (DUF1537 family)
MIGVIADDLTGAAEIGAVALRHGLRAEILVKGKPGGEADVVCVDTDSRSCARDESARRTAAAARLLKNAGAAWVYKKVDSVMRGQVAAEVQAIARELQLPRVLLHPANPSLGRTIQNGKYFIGNRPIHKTEFAHDPQHPRTSANVLVLLGNSIPLPIQVCTLTDNLPKLGIILCESTTPQDAQQWTTHRDSNTLLAGGAEFFAALLAANSNAMRPAKVDFNSGAVRELFVCGTTSHASKKFVRDAQRAGTPVFDLPGELAWGAEFTPAACDAIAQQALDAFKFCSRVILQIGLPSVHDAAAARKLSEHLTQLAATILRRADVNRVYAEGGATAAELVRQMKWTRFTVQREIAPGVATLAASTRKSLLLTIKPGSYLWPDEIRKFPATRESSKIPVEKDLLDPGLLSLAAESEKKLGPGREFKTL